MQRHSTSISSVIKSGAAVGLLACAAAAQAQLGSSGYVEQLAWFGGTSQNIARTPHAAVTTYTTDIIFGTSSGKNLVQFDSDPAPWVLAKTYGQNSNPNGGVSGGAQGRMIYAFTLQGDANSDIPLSFYGSALIQAANGASFAQAVATARFVLGNSVVELSAREGGGWDSFTKLGTNADVSRISRIGNIESGFFSGTALFHTDATGKASGSVDLTSTVSFSGSGTLTNVAYAYIDPELFFDPTWLNQHPNTSLAITQGVGNAVSAVPEAPTSLALVSGLALLSLRRWRERQAARD
jgi:hypothetical protein